MLPTYLVFLRGFACPLNEEQPDYSGTTHYASARVLRQLQATTTAAGGEAPQVGIADDLESLVKSVFALRHATIVPELHCVDDDYAAIDAVWQSWLCIRKAWEPVMAAAQAGNHDDVSECLATLMQSREGIGFE